MSDNRRRLATALIPLAVFAAACGGGGDAPSTDSASSTNDENAATTPPAAVEEPAGEAGEIVKTGFGQRDEFV